MKWAFLFILGMSAFAQEDIITQRVKLVQAKYHLPALGAVLVKDGQIVKSVFTGVRKIGGNDPVTIADQFHLGSCTKAMTTTLIGMFVERGKLSWKTKLVDVFPNINPHPAIRDITIEMLLAHRSGLEAMSPELLHLVHDVSLTPLMARKLVMKNILTKSPDSLPNSRFKYSNLGYIILGAVIDEISHSSYEQSIQALLFNPLQMQSCGFGPTTQVWGHEKVDKSYVPVLPDFHADNPPVYNSAGRVHCSIPDWLKFLQMHLDGFNKKQGLLLKTETFNFLHSVPPNAKEKEQYAYGAWNRSDRYWANGATLSHSGSNTLNYADVWIAPEKNMILISVVNAGSEDAAKGADHALDAFILE